jgi:protocatechuate 3,4-dioxygenase beta subunit
MSTKWTILVPILSVLATASPTPQEEQLSLSGKVIDATTGEPLPHALVQIFRFHDRGSAPYTARTLTDAARGFGFKGLAAGSYSISPQKPQFAPRRSTMH